MGKGDKKTKRGKISQGSYGKKRVRNSKSVAAIPVKVLDEKEEKAPKAVVEKKVAKPKTTTKNAEVADKKEEKPKTARKKKTEE